MRGVLFGAFVIACAAVHACDSFEESNPPAENDAGIEASTASDASDAGTDQSAPCGEPDWVTSGSAQPTATCGDATVDLRSTKDHCGRCGHSCGTEQCVEGMCVQRKEDDGAAIIYDVRAGVLYYAKRPGGSFGGKAHEIKRFVPGSGQQLLGSLEVDGSSETQISSAAAGSEHVYVRTNTSLRRVSLAAPSGGLPELVATLGPSDGLSSVQVAADRVYVTVPNPGRIDQVFFDGGVEPFISSVPNPGEARLSGDRYLYFSQKFIYFPFNEIASSLRLHDGAVDKSLYASDEKVGGLAPMEPNEKDVYVMRAGKSGSIVHINLDTGATDPFYEGDVDNSIFTISVATDATHVYWVKGAADATEVWKRARCGGAAVRIAKHGGAFRVVPVGDRLFIGAEDGLYSIVK